MSQDDYGVTWANQKLNMPRRRNELEVYIQRYLPELNRMDPGLVIDIGCGPGDFLSMCKEMGHDALGIDAPDGEGGMGDAYLELCKKYCGRFGVDVWRCGFEDVLMDSDTWHISQPVCCINLRGSIEQALSSCMVGPPHHEHHRADKLDWNTETAVWWLDKLMWFASSHLVEGGVLLIHANGTNKTDGWYDRAIRVCADTVGLVLVRQEGLLLHKWRKA